MVIPGLLFPILGIAALIINASQGFIARGIGNAVLLIAVYFAAACGYIKLRTSARIVVDDHYRTVTIHSSTTLVQQRTWTFDELQERGYCLESTEGFVETVHLVGPDDRFRIDALSLYYQSDNSGLHHYDLPPPFNVLSFELQQGPPEAWSTTLLRVAMLRW